MFLNSRYAFAIHYNWTNKIENVILFIFCGTRTVAGERCLKYMKSISLACFTWHFMFHCIFVTRLCDYINDTINDKVFTF